MTKVDLREWDLADWPERLAAAVKTPRTITIKYEAEDIDRSAFEKIAMQVAEEAIEAFLTSANEGYCPVELTKDGVLFKWGKERLVVPWEKLLFSDHEEIIEIIKQDRAKYE